MNRFSVPYMAGTVLIAWNAERVPGEPEQLCRRVHVAGARRQNHRGEGQPRDRVVGDANAWDRCERCESGQTLEQAKPVLEKWVKLIKKYDSDSPKTDLLEGNVDIGVIWNGEAALLLSDKRFKVAVPSEGPPRSIDNLAIPVGAKHKADAEQLINYILRPEVSKIISDQWPYTNPNGEARKLLSPEQLNNAASYPKLTNSELFKDIGKRRAARRSDDE